jgi:hypothetical protein
VASLAAARRVAGAQVDSLVIGVAWLALGVDKRRFGCRV